METHLLRGINFHFHENEGIQSADDSGDQHALPLGSHIHGYLNYLRRAVQERIPLILEVNTKANNPIQVMVVMNGISAILEHMERERLYLIRVVLC